MSIVKAIRGVAMARATWGESQNFLGARWVEKVVSKSPARMRESVALRALSFSPHYFYGRDLRVEAQRNRDTRRALAACLLEPHLSKTSRVVDYGCGPGYMAYAVADKVDHIFAVDISRGVLACAKVLNNQPNITYLSPSDLEARANDIDLAYSFAVVQHLRTDKLTQMLELLAAMIRPGGLLLLHFALPGGQDRYRTESDWTSDRSLRGRARLHYGLNCFGRSADEMKILVQASGFTDVHIQSLSGVVTVPGGDDVARQHWLTARSPMKDGTRSEQSQAV
jgi:cyclopropane fatty-acyl-phospholipid synthase-like methyltransferase